MPRSTARAITLGSDVIMQPIADGVTFGPVLPSVVAIAKPAAAPRRGSGIRVAARPAAGRVRPRGEKISA